MADTATASSSVLAPLLDLLERDPTYQSLKGAPGSLAAVPEPARAFVVAALATGATGAKGADGATGSANNGAEPACTLVAVATRVEAERLAHDLSAYSAPGEVELFPAWETLPFERVSPSIETMGLRLRAMWRLRSAALQDPPSQDRPPRILVAPVRSLLQRLGPHVEQAAPVTITTGSRVDQEELVARLVGMGYRREYQVEHKGELAVRGSIVDVFGPTADGPVRIDLWGDEVDRLGEFDVDGQRLTSELEHVELFACREVLPTDQVRERARLLAGEAPWGRQQWERLAEGLVFDGMESWLPWLTSDEHLILDLLPPGSLVVLVDPRRMRDRAAEIIDEEAALATTLAGTWGAGTPGPGPPGTGFPRLHLPFDRLLANTEADVRTLLPAPEGPATEAIAASGWEPVTAGGDRLIGQLRDLRGRGWSIVACADTPGSGTRIAGLLADHGFAAPFHEASPPPAELTKPGIKVVVQPLDRGFVYPVLELAVLSENDLTGRRRSSRHAPRPRSRTTEAFFDDLTPGSYVVHYTHGVARFGGMVRRPVGGVERDYLLLEYKGDDRLYVPSDQVDLLRPYTGGETPAVNRLGGSEWTRTKDRVRAAAREIAADLIALYRERLDAKGHPFAPDTPWQAELEESFPYVETPDQLRAVEEVKTDMESETPMDRLVCGDVGFGKTEVAVRAAFKAVQDGKQVAVLVPTTLLASQHHQTFSDRFAGFPVRVEMLSRFVSPADSRRIIDGLATGSVDVVIGTHRLLSQDVTFRDLGLLVVDEEQRFGVSHKEAIKKLRTNVDVLTLTANPIPRTLEMSLTGIRDMTLLQTPPADRQPILTYVGEYDERATAEAIRRELLREGQVFYVHNRVQDIEKVAAEVRALVPEARVVIAHGQMDEAQLEKTVFDFWEGRHDVLVCTTIIESGIDMPTVNTLVVDRSDLLGMGQLHQLRGRVGRAGQRAYAYLLFPPDRSLTEEAYERLRTIGEHTELGSGFKIAMRDLEIRGAGNLLGGDQSGHIAAVGYDLYVQMVSEAVAELKGEEPSEPAEIKLDLPMNANLPSDYVTREDLRIEAYRRLATVTSHAEADDIEAEWIDRFGPIPDPARALLDIGHLRAECSRLGIKEVSVVSGGTPHRRRLTARLSPVELKLSEQVRLSRLAPGSTYKADQGQVVLPLLPAAPQGKTQSPASHIAALLAEVVPS